MKQRAAKAAKRAGRVAAQPTKPSRHPFQDLHVGGGARRLAEGRTDFRIPGGSAELEVVLDVPIRCGMPWTAVASQTVDVDLSIEGGPEGDHRPTSITLYPNDIPALIACLVHAAYVGIVDGVLPVTHPEGIALVKTFRAQLSEFEFYEKREAPNA
jgi:hypothetical protein